MIGLLLGKIKESYSQRQLRNAIARCHANATIGHHFRAIPRVMIQNQSGDRSRVVIGHHCQLNCLVVCAGEGKIEIGNYCSIQWGASILAVNKIKIGNFCGIASNSYIVDNNNHRTDIEGYIEHRIRVAGEGYPGLGLGWELSESSPIVIGDGVWVGGNSTVLKGVTIGDGAIVARGSIVTKDVEPFTLVAGNPAKVVKKLPQPDVSVAELAERILQRNAGRG